MEENQTPEPYEGSKIFKSIEGSDSFYELTEKFAAGEKTYPELTFENLDEEYSGQLEHEAFMVYKDNDLEIDEEIIDAVDEMREAYNEIKSN